MPMFRPRKFYTTLRGTSDDLTFHEENLIHLCFVGRVPSNNSDEENQMYYAILAVGFVVIVALGIVVGVLWRKLKRSAMIPLPY